MNARVHRSLALQFPPLRRLSFADISQLAKKNGPDQCRGQRVKSCAVGTIGLSGQKYSAVSHIGLLLRCRRFARSVLIRLRADHDSPNGGCRRSSVWIKCSKRLIPVCESRQDLRL
jgi:hypothetical protein